MAQSVNPFVADWQAALTLGRALASGIQPLPVPVPHFLPPNEICYAVLPVRIEQRMGVELAFATHTQSHAAAAHWAPLETGLLALTPQRLALWPNPAPHQASRQVLNYGWNGLHGHWLELAGTVLDYGPDGNRRRMYRICTQQPVWFHVLTCFVAFNELVPLAPPPHIARALGR